MGRGDTLRCHAIIIDDLMMFKTVANRDVQTSAEAGDRSRDVSRVCKRYRDVGARVRDE